MVKKYIITGAMVLILTFSTVTAFADVDSHTEKTLEKPMDKTPILKMIEESDKEIGYSEFYKNANPNDKDFDEKFKELAIKIDKYNKKRGFKNTFDLNKILKSSNLKEDTSISMGGGSGDGTNDMDAGIIANGDIVLVDNPGDSLQGSIQHAGMMVRSRYNGNADDKCFHSAQPDLGVVFETQDQYRRYDTAYKLGVATTITAKNNAVNQSLVDATAGEPYYWYTDKNNTTSWYCSKVPWNAYNSANAGYIDIDFDGGYWVLPSDIFADNDTALYHIWY